MFNRITQYIPMFPHHVAFWRWTTYILPFDETNNAVLIVIVCVCIKILLDTPSTFLPQTLPIAEEIKIFSNRVVTEQFGVIAALITVNHGRIQRIDRFEKPITKNNPSGTDDDERKPISFTRVKNKYDKVIFYDYTDKVILPGLVDIHAHLNEPGRTEWEGVESGTKSAAVGGITTLVDMPLNSIPSTVDLKSFEEKIKAVKKGSRIYCDLAFWGGLVPQNARNESSLEDLLSNGVVGLKTFMSPAGTAQFDQSSLEDIKIAMKTLAKFNAPLMVHAELPPAEEDASLTNGKDARKYSTYMNSRPRKWEKVCHESACARFLILLSKPLTLKKKRERER
jgi:hypothetical protein